ncbi:hypothetical protein [Halobacillus sp. B29]|uniref:hypothetical protein n=1 Tax=Halobacillus sp. B29 TaxID=3457432 RepID=UPI003FCE0095
MKALRWTLYGFLAVLLIVIIFFQINKDFNQLAQGQAYPMTTSPERRPVSLTSSPLEIEGSGVQVTPLYHGLDTGKLYLGISYGKLDLSQKKNYKWKKEDGAVQFLVKVVDTNGTNFSGKTTGTVKGTFSTFQYVQVEDFDVHEKTEALTLLFYPLMDKKGKDVPSEQPSFQVNVPIQ